jgi:hypothetical protein
MSVPEATNPQRVQPAPITGHHAPLDGFPARVIVCDVTGLAATLDTIDASSPAAQTPAGEAAGSNYGTSTAP